MRSVSTLATTLGAVALGLVTAAPALAPTAPSAPTASPPAVRMQVRHGLSIAVPTGWRVTYRHFTPCSDPAERFSLTSGGQVVLMVQERATPAPSELAARPRHFAVRGRPLPLECCSIAGRSGWVLRFGDHGRAFYAYLYSGHASPATALRALDSFRAVPANPL